MNKIFIIVFSAFLLSGCLFNNSDNESDDYKPGDITIYNFSDSAIYVYMKCGGADSLPLEPGLDLFLTADKVDTDKCGNTIFEPIISPEYRVNAFRHGFIKVGGDERTPKLPCDGNEVTLFFIKEKVMREYNWEQIYKGQMYVERVTLTEEKLDSLCWRYSYISPELRQDNGRVLIPFYGYPKDGLN